MKKGIHHVGITAAQFEKTVRLYQDGLGFTVKHIWGRDKRVYMMEICEESYVEVFEGEAEGGKTPQFPENRRMDASCPAYG